MPGSDTLLMLGDFNARVDYRKGDDEDDDVWSAVLSLLWTGCKKSGWRTEEFLSFCEIN